MTMLNRPNNDKNRPKDTAKENARLAIARDIEKRREESKKRWEDAAAARKAAQEKTEEERKLKALAMKQQTLDVTQAKLRAKTAEKEAIEEKIKRLEAFQQDEARDEIEALRKELDRVDREKIGFSSEAIREEQVVKRLKSSVDIKGYEEDY